MSIFDRIANVFSRSKLEREIDAEIPTWKCALRTTLPRECRQMGIAAMPSYPLGIER
jgi:hypothetical protein